MYSVHFSTSIPITDYRRFALADTLVAYARKNFPGRECRIMIVGEPSGFRCIVTASFEKLGDATMFASTWQGFV